MIDIGIVQKRLRDRIMDMCFESIVTDNFIGALPIPSADLTDGLTQKFAGYSSACLKDLGSYSLLAKAIESCTDLGQRNYLKQIQAICMETATTVSDRILEENKGNEEMLTDKVEHIAMTPKEYAKFSSAAAKVTPAELSKMIQKKTLDVIKEEKEAYKKDQELEKEIKAALAESGEDDSDAISVPDISTEIPGTDTAHDAADASNKAQSEAEGNESYGHQMTSAQETELDAKYQAYMHKVCGDNFQPKHQSMFAKIQEMAVECVLYATESFDAIPFEAMTKVTTQRTFGAFKSHNSMTPMERLESACSFVMESEATPDAPEDTQQKALLTASIIYTFFETLYSMGLYSPKVAEIREFVEHTLPLEKKIEIDKNVFMNAIDGIIASTLNTVAKSTATPVLDDIEKNMDMVREKCEANPNFAYEAAVIGDKLDKVKKAIDIKRNQIAASQRPAKAVESFTAQMQRTRDTVKFSRAATSVCDKAVVDHIRIKVDPQVNSNYVALEAMSANNRIMGTHTIVLEGAFESDLPGYVERMVRGSKLSEIHRPVAIVDRRSGKTYMHERFTSPGKV